MFHLFRYILRWYLRKATGYQKRDWNRTLPFGESVSDRWSKAKFLGFGDKSSIYDSAIVFGDVEVGENTWIGPNVVLDGSGAKLRIGSFCSISAGVQIYTHNSVAWSLSGGNALADIDEVTIGNNCYIGPNVVIAKGVQIGDGTIIGANSFVNTNLPPNTKAWGIPAKIVDASE
jgi:acetyltransferase-like isoleucine patch superfamily enzyme